MFNPFEFFAMWQKPKEDTVNLSSLKKMEGKLMTKLTELADKLNAIDDKLMEAGDEITEELEKLREALANVTLSEAAENALDSIEARAQQLADFVVDDEDTVADETVTAE